VLLLGAAGRAYHSLVSTNFDTGLPECRFFMKLPAIVADGATAIVLFFVVKKLKSGSVAWGLTAGLAYAVHPAVIYDSMAWGQIDSVFSCFALVTVVALVSGRWALVGAFGALALLTKLQAVVVMPMAAVLCLLERRRLVRATFSAAATTVAVFASFLSGPALQAIKGVYLGSAGFYSVLSMQGYNAWVALFGLGEADRSDLDLFFGAVRYRTVGVALFAVCATAFALVGLRRLRLATTHESRARILFLVSALTAYAFFLVNTEVHERYLFALMPLALPLAFLGRTEGWLYLASSSLFFLNLLGPLPWTNLDRALFRELPNLPAFIGACHILVFGRLATRLWRNVPHAPESH
jgi:Gpi18-like mannosyltransferase